MVRSSLALLLVSICVLACGGEADDAPRLQVYVPAAAEASVPFDLAVLRGRAPADEVLKLRVTRGEETYACESDGGSILAFRIDREGAAAPVALPGVATLPSPTAMLTAVRERLAAAEPPVDVREGWDDRAFVVTWKHAGDTPDALALNLATLTATTDLRFLIEVLPKERYREWHPGQEAPRLAAKPYPWPDTVEAFDRFKEAEVARWKTAKAAGLPYAPSREDLLVLPRYGTSGEGIQDFHVLEWPADPEDRFDGGALRDPLVGRDPSTGKPTVLYDIAVDRQDAFAAWTGANVGLPMAIVIDWELQTAPVINSPLRDRVQIALGQGSYRELKAQSEALTQAIQGGTGALPVAFVAALSRWDDGSFEVLVPLADEGEVAVEVESASGSVARTIRHRALVDAEAPYAPEAVLGAMTLGRLEAEAGAARLRSFSDAVVASLADVVASDASLARRVHAAQLLGLVDRESKAAGDALIAALGAPSPSVRSSAAHALAHLRAHPEAAGAILAAMEGLPSEDQVPLVRALGPLAAEDESARDALLRMIVGEDRALSFEARTALEDAPWPESAQKRMAEEAADPEIRAAAVTLVTSGGFDEELIPWLVQRAGDESPRVRIAATAGLQAFAWSEAKETLRPHAEALFGLLEDPEEEVRHLAAMTLGELGGDVLPRLLTLARHERVELRRAAMLALGRSEELRADALSVIADALGDADLRTRLLAAWPYLQHGGAEADALVVLEEGLAAEDERSDLRRMALALLLEKDLKPAAGHDAVKALLDDEDETVQVLAAMVLMRDGVEDERARKLIEAVERDESHPLHGYASGVR